MPDVGAKIELTQDQRSIETRSLGFAISPHEECAVEQAVQLIEKEGGSGTVLTVGPSEAEEQLRESIARGIGRGILVQTDGQELDANQAAHAIVNAIESEQANGEKFDLIMFGNESADSSNSQVGIIVAHRLDLPCISGVKRLEINDNNAIAKREITNGWEVFETPLPAVITTKDGLNLPRHPSLRGTMMAKKKKVDRVSLNLTGPILELIKFHHPEKQDREAEILGEGPNAACKVVEVFRKLEVLS